MNLTIIGTGFVGVVSSAVYASLGHQVIGLDVDEKKINLLQNSQVPFYEPGLEDLLKKTQQQGNLHFTTDYQQAIKNADLIIIAVGTPSAPSGQADLKYIFAAGQSLGPYLKNKAIIAIKSTVPPGTLKHLHKIIQEARNKASIPALSDFIYYTASLPEFLKEGSAVSDTLKPDRIIIGATDEYVFKQLEKLHQPFKAPILKMRPESAQMTKYAANSYLATRITFINQMANLCEINGANIDEVIAGIGADKRIGKHYWYPGFGYGGSCFPKDVKELAAYARSVKEDDNLMIVINQLNQNRIPNLLTKYEKKLSAGFANKIIAVLGLSFKPNTDDTREAPATQVIPYLISKKAIIQSYDPLAKWQPDPNKVKLISADQYQQMSSISAACHQAAVIMPLIEWPAILKFNFAQVRIKNKAQLFIDARNQFNPEKISKLGYQYLGIGRNAN